MKRPERIFIPTVPFFGRIRDKQGKYINGPASLYPQCDTRSFEVGEYMFGMQNYHFTIENGYFYVEILPNDFGVEKQYFYLFETPERIWKVALDSNGPHDFTKMLAKTGKYL